MDFAAVAQFIPLLPMLKKRPTELTRDDINLIGGTVGVQVTDDLYTLVQQFVISLGDSSLTEILSGMTLDKFRGHMSNFVQGRPNALDAVVQCPVCNALSEQTIQLQ